MGFGTALSSGFPCGFNTVGRLGPLHEVGRQWACAGLRNLQVDGTAIIRPPTSLVYLTNLEELSISGCKESTSNF